MSDQEKCQLCGGKVGINAWGGKRCLSDDQCQLSHAYARKEDFDRIQSALAMLKRTESGECLLIRADQVALPQQMQKVAAGEAVVIEKRDGEWPTFMKYTMVPELWSIKNPVRDRGMITADTFPKAAAAWNQGAP